MIWLLIAISASSSNYGNVSSVEFNSKQQCLEARELIKVTHKTTVDTFCIQKGSENDK